MIKLFELSKLEIKRQLELAESREKAWSLLNDTSFFLKKDWLALCKLLDIHTTRQDSIQKLKERIVENTVGFKIRSRVIRGF